PHTHVSDRVDRRTRCDFNRTRLVSSLSFFFFYCSGAHRDLHSFPTRRSSDLSGALSATWAGALADRHGRRLACLAFCVTYSLSRSEEHTSELQSLRHLVCRLLLEKKKNKKKKIHAKINKFLLP